MPKVMKSKRKIMWRLTGLFGAIILGVLLFFISCEKETIAPESSQRNVYNEKEAEDVKLFPEYCGELMKKSIFLKDGVKVGDAYLFNDTKFLYVRLVASDQRLFHYAYLFAGDGSMVPLDQNKNPLFKAFPYKMEADNLTEVRRFMIPLSELPEIMDISLMVEVSMVAQSIKTVQGRFQQAWVEGRNYGYSSFGKMLSYERRSCTRVEPFADPM
jgi:hypothetical protein